MNNDVFKQIVFDCIMELTYGQKGLTKEAIADELLRALKSNDEWSGGNLKKAVFEKAFVRSGRELGADPAYFGEEGETELEEQLNRLGFTLNEMQ